MGRALLTMPGGANTAAVERLMRQKRLAESGGRRFSSSNVEIPAPTLMDMKLYNHARIKEFKVASRDVITSYSIHYTKLYDDVN